MPVATLNTLQKRPHFILTQILSAIIKSILQIKWLGQSLTRRMQESWNSNLDCLAPECTLSGSVTAPPHNCRGRMSIPIWMPHCALIINKLKRNTIISLLKKVSSSNVPKLSQWTFYFLRCKMPFISSFIFFPVSSFVFLLLTSVTSFHIGFRHSKISELCVPLWFIM